MRRWIVLGVAVVGVAWGPYVYSELTRSPRPAPHPVAPDPEPTPQPLPLVAASQTPRVHRESQLSAATTRDLPHKPLVAETPAPVQPPAPALEPARKPLAAVSGEALSQRFRSVFDDEPRDAFWAVDEEPRLRGLLETVGVEQSAIGDVACRKTVCRVAFNSPDMEPELATKLSSRMREAFAELALETHHDSESEARATLYVLRSGFVLEPPTRAAR